MDKNGYILRPVQMSWDFSQTFSEYLHIYNICPRHNKTQKSYIQNWLEHIFLTTFDTNIIGSIDIMTQTLTPTESESHP